MTKTPNRRLMLASLALAATALATLPATAQNDWPRGQTIRFVVPFTAGSGTDIVARLVGDKLGPALGTSVIIDNKPGAGGTLGAALVAKAAPDGYTVLIHSAGHLVNASIYPNLSYDTLKDFAGVTPLATLPNVLVTGPDKFKDVKDLVAQAKAKPGSFNYGSAGNGSATHMNAEVFRLAAGVQAQHVPFRGTPEAMTETMSGRIDWFFAPLVSSLPLIKDGKLKALAVGTARRSASLPQVPTTVEAGEFIHTFGDLHIYSNHLEQVNELLSREPMALPTLQFVDAEKLRGLDGLLEFKFENLRLDGYHSWGKIAAPVAV